MLSAKFQKKVLGITFLSIRDKWKKQKFTNGRSDVRSSLTYPPTYIRYHQIQLDISTYLVYLPKNLTSYVNAPLRSEWQNISLLYGGTILCNITQPRTFIQAHQDLSSTKTISKHCKCKRCLRHLIYISIIYYLVFSDIFIFIM